METFGNYALKLAEHFHNLSNSKKYRTRAEIIDANEVLDKEKFINEQEKLIEDLSSLRKQYESLIKKDPARRKGKERLKLIESMGTLLDKLEMYPPKSDITALPLIDLERERLEYEIEVSDIIETVRKFGLGDLQEEWKDLFRGTALEFLVIAGESVDEMHHEFVRGFVTALLEDGRDMKSFLSALKDNPLVIVDSILEPLKLLGNLDWETVKMMPEIIDVISEGMLQKISDSDGEYAPFLAGKISASVITALLFKNFSSLKKIHGVLKHADKAASGTKMASKMIMQMGDNYSLLTEGKNYRILIENLYLKFPQMDIFEVREAVERMIRMVLTLPSAKQAEAVNSLLRFLNTRKLSDLKSNKDLEKWLSGWLQKVEKNEVVSRGLELWDDRFEQEAEQVEFTETKLEEMEDEIDKRNIFREFFAENGNLILDELELDKEVEEFNAMLNEVESKGKIALRKFVFENRSLFRRLVLDVTPFGWRVDFEEIAPGIVSKIQAYIGLGDLFAENELMLGFQVTYPGGYNGDKVLIATKRNGRKYENKDGKYLAIFSGCDIII